MQTMDYEQNQQHVSGFLASTNYRKLTANQQKHAELILTRFNQFMQQDEQRDDQHWTVASIKAVLLGEFASDRQVADRKFLVAAVPVLKAYQSFLQPTNLAAISKTLEENKQAMQTAGRRRLASAQLNELKHENQQLHQLVAQKEHRRQIEQLKRDIWPGLIKQAEFRRIETDEDTKLMIAEIFIDDLAVRFMQQPAQWTEESVSTVLAGMLPLDARLDLEDANFFIPVVRSLVNYLSVADQVTVKHAAQLLMWLSDYQPVVTHLATLDDDARHATAVAQLMIHQGIKPESAAEIDTFLDEKYDDVLDYMTWLQPWIEEVDDEFDDQDILFGLGEEDLTPIEMDQLRQTNAQNMKNVLAQFKQSPYYRHLSRSEQRDAAAIVESVADWMIDTTQEILDDWSPEGIAMVLTDVMPSKTTGSQDFFAHIAPVMAQFLTFATTQDLIFLGDDVLAALNQIKDQILPKSQDRSQWGQAKKMGMQMRDAGVDFSDRAAIDAFIEQANATSDSDSLQTSQQQPRKVIPFNQTKRQHDQKKN